MEWVNIWEKKGRKKKRKKEGGTKSKERKRKKRWQYKENKIPRFNKKSIMVAKQLSWGYPEENELGVRVP